MAREDKAATIAELTEEFRTSSAAVLTEYRGLTVSQIGQLRRSLKGVATYAVVKNTLTRIAAREAGVEGFDELLTGPSAIAFIKGDPVEGAKGLKDFSKENPLLVLKAAYMDGRVLDAAEVKKLADLESREVLLAKLAGAMKASMSQAASLFAAPLSQAARTVEALRVKAEADPSIIGGAGVAAAVAAESDEPESIVDKAEDVAKDVAGDVAHVVGDVAHGVENVAKDVAHAVEGAVGGVAHAVEGAVGGVAHKIEEVLRPGSSEAPESTTESEG
jgi:large subunit ribosomal protein L10